MSTVSEIKLTMPVPEFLSRLTAEHNSLGMPSGLFIDETRYELIDVHLDSDFQGPVRVSITLKGVAHVPVVA